MNCWLDIDMKHNSRMFFFALLLVFSQLSVSNTTNLVASGNLGPINQDQIISPQALTPSAPIIITSNAELGAIAYTVIDNIF